LLNFLKLDKNDNRNISLQSSSSGLWRISLSKSRIVRLSFPFTLPIIAIISDIEMLVVKRLRMMMYMMKYQADPKSVISMAASYVKNESEKRHGMKETYTFVDDQSLQGSCKR
jgi:hypothetical protein